MSGVFTWRPDYPIQEDRAPKTNEASMGDGYLQRAAHGINNNPGTIQFTFTSRTLVEGNAIMDFLDSKGGHESFSWTNLRGQTYLFICKQYGRTDNEEDDVSVKATFMQVFGG